MRTPEAKDLQILTLISYFAARRGRAILYEVIVFKAS
jgi:hypothetical protein